MFLRLRIISRIEVHYSFIVFVRIGNSAFTPLSAPPLKNQTGDLIFLRVRIKSLGQFPEINMILSRSGFVVA